MSDEPLYPEAPVVIPTPGVLKEARSFLYDLYSRFGVSLDEPLPDRHGGTARILNPDEEGRERGGYAPPYPESDRTDRSRP